MDWSTAALLAALLWADGVRRVAAGSLVLRRVLGGPWRVADVATDDGWRPVGWWPPLSLSIVLPPDGADATAPTRSGRGVELPLRLARVAGHLRLLRAIGTAVVLVLLVVLPAAAWRFGAFGFLGAVALLLPLGVACAAVAVHALGRLGTRGRAAWRLGAPLVWPFAGPTGAERVLGAAIGDASRIDVALALLDPAELARWVRPLAYDALHDALHDAAARTPEAPTADLGGSLAERLGRARLRAIVADPPAALAPGCRYCPRCGATYRPTFERCADCRRVRLRRAPMAGVDGRPRRVAGVETRGVTRGVPRSRSS